tara:strand:- start:3720 stop:3911 length:192 start_codon:yes stop_codon:yes gene_type:complete
MPHNLKGIYIMSDYEEARIEWLEDNYGSIIGFAEAYRARTKENIIDERSKWVDEDEYQNEQWD